MKRKTIAFTLATLALALSLSSCVELLGALLGAPAPSSQLAAAAQQAVELTPGTPVSGNISRGGQDWYSVWTTAGGTIIVETTGNIDTYLEAYDESGTRRIAEDDDSGQGHNARLQISAQAGSTYLFKVRGLGSSSGPYGISATTPALVAEQQRQQQLAQQQQAQQEEAPQRQLQLSGESFDVRQNTDNTLTITSYKGTSRNVVIPSTIQGLRVTAIGNSVFESSSLRMGGWSPGITSIEIPNTVITIGRRAFYTATAGMNMNQIPTVVIPNSITTIGEEAFRVAGITRLSLGTGLQTIGNSAFEENKITELTLPASIKSIGESAFFRNQIRSLTIPNGVTIVGSIAFARNSIATLVIPASLATNGIGQNAFAINPITRITVPANMSDSYFTGNTNIGFEQGFINFYRNQNKAAGTYVKNGQIWSRQ